ncbi:MAG: DUF3631 domain-containing protein [Candidatus Contendobacter sp.]|nr:MAG: DUF3631 domain-containing protein [Candidatus Contendobacter sp.]
MTSLADVVAALDRANCQPTRTGNDTYTARCPVHEADGGGHKPSLSVARGDKVDVVLNCHAGCSHVAIMAALGIEHTSKATSGKAGASRRIVATYPYTDACGKLFFEKIRYEPKDFRIHHQDAGGAEVWRLPRGIEPPLYRLPAVQVAMARGEPIYLVEGEKDADRLAAAGLCATTNFDGAAGSQKPKWRDSYTAALAGADVVLLPDNDEPGKAHMRHVAAALAGKALVRWLELPGLPAKGDVSDWLNAGHSIDELKQLATDAPADERQPAETQPPPDAGGHADDDAEIALLAALNPIQYDRQRTAAAKRLGIRGDTLDKLVKAARGEPDKDSNAGGSALEFDDVEPWSEPVDGAALLNELAASVKRHMALPEHAAAAIALWVTSTYIVVNHGHIAPMLAITSPEKRCGKTTLLDWLSRLVERPLKAANITASAIFRTVDVCKPTLLIDEADSFLGESGDELRGILNSGHSRTSAYVIRCCGDNAEPRRFSTWSCKAVALIGKLEGKYSTLADRSIEIQLRRKLPAEKLMKLRHVHDGHFDELARRCARFALDNGAAIGAARPDIPDCLNDRAQDNWEPLLAIADVAAGAWPRLARTVAIALSGGADTGGGDAGGSLGVQLLSDLRRYFEGGNATSYPTTALLRFLNEIDDAPWPAFAKGKPMTARHLSRLLHPYGITRQTFRAGMETAKGYHVADFADAFSRYLPHNGNKVTSQSNSGFSPDSVSVTDSACYRNDDAGLASQEAACNRVTDKRPMSGTASGGADVVTDTDADDWF